MLVFMLESTATEEAAQVFGATASSDNAASGPFVVWTVEEPGPMPKAVVLAAEAFPSSKKGFQLH